ncbi:hypothetical protein [Chitinophaga niabensis]|uniref:EF-hand domain-containing protein n=1 Tax=Chitinophaga niabensis TaxID=536979 RepID=A0A1N6JFR9_9BACT|nr:hypothetical protein [Chitinophaga niabensis]SIO43051.1 hypothetical protein SAMN04488055_3961 [Chitinophaga niabensis]
MLDQLVQLVRDSAQETVVANPAIPNEQNDAVIGEASHSIASGLQEALASGNVKDVMGLFNSNGQVDNSNPVVNNISGNLISSLTEKFNLNGSTAAAIAGSLIPSVLGSLVKKTNDPSDNGFSLDGIFSSLTGGSTQGLNLGSLLGKFAGGLDKDGDGDVDLQDMVGMISNGAKQQQGSGGLGGLLGGIFGK